MQGLPGLAVPYTYTNRVCYGDAPSHLPRPRWPARPLCVEDEQTELPNATYMIIY